MNVKDIVLVFTQICECLQEKGLNKVKTSGCLLKIVDTTWDSVAGACLVLMLTNLCSVL